MIMAEEKLLNATELPAFPLSTNTYNPPNQHGSFAAVQRRKNGKDGVIGHHIGA